LLRKFPSRHQFADYELKTDARWIFFLDKGTSFDVSFVDQVGIAPNLDRNPTATLTTSPSSNHCDFSEQVSWGRLSSDASDQLWAIRRGDHGSDLLGNR
jgi:hypothetical protein